MKKLLLALFLLLIGTTVNAVSLPYTHHFDNYTNWTFDGQLPSDPDLSITTDATSPDSTTNVGRWRYISGYADGYCPATIFLTFTAQSELYFQYYFKYSSNFTHHPVEDKHFFLWNNVGTQNFYGAWGLFSNEFTLDLQGSGGIGPDGSKLLSTSGANLQNNTWYKIKIRVKINTGSNLDGIAQVWINDVLRLNKSGVRFWNSATTFRPISFCPVWGGYQGETVPQEQYFYIDGFQIQATPFGSVGGTDTTPAAFSFTDITNAARSTQQTTSPCITVTGIDTTAAISISGTGCTYNVNGGSYTSGASTVGSGNTVCQRGTSSASYSTVYPSCTLTIGGVTDSLAPWTATTTFAGPVLTSPVNLATIDDPVTFQWQAVSGATKYNIEIDDNSDYSSPVIDIETTSTSYTVSVGILMPARTYYWHVRAYK